MKLQAILEPSDEGGYTVFVPGLSGCISEGNTEDEALTNIREAIDLYFEPIDDNIPCGEGARKVELVI
uniref:HicB_like antitoxin of toxin-antitoxin system n=1 Tax=Candidatus Kentrum sp. MB TaxID=2138164 RepID=A0A450XJU0_9GAMM|nr:MAG: HicB_like antitoxin of toxin-antitoxin system [Candidatus Kentron sp. MB]VFK29557.1 MAG: HicB_like antitoxin of toxin-antitoxin system [Candidatus Kentron sp. MB]VFK74828.1 MAG: HicB_like antitoxin of toxin-antitoxin system [Candidatus Kentron sp. MB]